MSESASIGQGGWRVLHYATFGLFIAAMAHGLWMGTDSSRPLVQLSYLASGVEVLFLTFFRILAARSVARPRRAEAAPSRAPDLLVPPCVTPARSAHR